MTRNPLPFLSIQDQYLTDWLRLRSAFFLHDIFNFGYSNIEAL
ncbi:hypothetical protein DSUL_100062 [Desulfovibrionales bacterium]